MERETTSLLFDELRLQLRREHDLPPSKTSKPAIAQVALELQAKNMSQLAEQLARGQRRGIDECGLCV